MRPMRVYWKIRYVDRTERKMKDRILFLDLGALPLDLQFCIRYKIEAENLLDSYELRNYRQYFTEVDHMETGIGYVSTLGPVFYFEDEAGNLVYEREVRQIIGLDPSELTFPFPPYVERYLAFKGSASDITLNEEELRSLRIFSELYEELESMQIQPPGLEGIPDREHVVFKNSETEIKAFVMLFRKLYSSNPDDYGSFPNVSRLLQGHPNTALGQLAEDSLGYFTALKEMDIRSKDCARRIIIWGSYFEKYPEPITVDDFIRLMLYTQYQHSPKKSKEEKLNGLRHFLNSTDCDETLKYIFLAILHSFQILFLNVGGSYSGVMKQLCDDLPQSLPSAQIKQIGERGIPLPEMKKLKIKEKYVRIYAQELWNEAGRKGTPYEFEPEAAWRMQEIARAHR